MWRLCNEIFWHRNVETETSYSIKGYSDWKGPSWAKLSSLASEDGNTPSLPNITSEHMLLSRHQNAGQNHGIKMANRCFEYVAQFRYLGITRTNQNSILKKIKGRLNSGNACYHLVQNLSSSRLLSKNIKIRIYKTIILPLVLYGCENWSLI
jgi:hypothetical protein